MRKMARCKMHGIITVLDKIGLICPALVFDYRASRREGATGRRIDWCRRIAFKQDAGVGCVRIK